MSNTSLNKKSSLHGGATAKKFAFAEDLRANMTETEKLLWEQLRLKKCEGLKFRRQHPYGKFVLDFYCHSEKLCVEIDGGIHKKKMNADYDELRTSILKENGIDEIRFTNQEVLDNISDVMARIKKWIAEVREKRKTVNSLNRYMKS